MDRSTVFLTAVSIGHPRPFRRTAGRLAGVVLGLLLLARCVAAGPALHLAAGEPLAASAPTRLRIPAIDLDSRGLVELGLRADRTMEVPADARTVGWFRESPTPGERGPAVLAAHVDQNYQKGAFYDLDKLGQGDEVIIDRADGSTALFEVSRIEQYPKDDFPSQDVYGDVDDAELRLITCGGEVDRRAHSYRDNLVVYAGLVRSSRGRRRPISAP
jgi:LPXTG-site transpeptidase (sortase) family protein